MRESTFLDLNHGHKVNKPGICKLYALLRKDVTFFPDEVIQLQSMAPDANRIFVESILFANDGWLSISNDMNVSISIEEKVTTSVHGQVTEYQVLLDIPNDDYHTRGKIIDAYSGREFLLLVRLGNGTYRVVGDNNKGAEFQSALNSSTKLKPANITRCGFILSTATKALYTQEYPAGYLDITVEPDGDENILLAIYTDRNMFLQTYGDGIGGNRIGAHTFRYGYPNAGTFIARLLYSQDDTILDLQGVDEGQNRIIKAIVGKLPPLLTQLYIQNNRFTGGRIMVLAQQLAANGQLNGTADFSNQTPAVTSYPAPYTTAKNQLIARGWTIID